MTVPAARVHPHRDDPRLWDRDGAAALLRDGPDGDHVVVCFIPTALGERLLDARFAADGR